MNFVLSDQKEVGWLAQQGITPAQTTARGEAIFTQEQLDQGRALGKAQLVKMTAELEATKTAKATAETQLGEANKVNEQLTAALAPLQNRQDELAQRLSVVETERDKVSAANAELQAKLSMDFGKATAKAFRALAIRPRGVRTVPGQVDGGDLGAIRAAMCATSDPVERGRLARAARTARGDGKLFEEAS